MLRLHGSYQLDQLSNRQLENGLMEAVAVLISKMPRLRPESAVGNLGECFKSKPDFIKAWEKWRSQITKLDCSSYWIQCDNQETCDGLRNLLQIMLGNTESLCTVSCYWIELYVSHFLYIRPFTIGIESMYNLAQKCIQLKPPVGTHRLTGLIIGILGENTEVVLAECSREFGPWMVAHAMELLTAGSEQAEVLLHDERYNLGGISIVELHRLAYAQVLSSHALTWQVWQTLLEGDLVVKRFLTTETSPMLVQLQWHLLDSWLLLGKTFWPNSNCGGFNGGNSPLHSKKHRGSTRRRVSGGYRRGSASLPDVTAISGGLDGEEKCNGQLHVEGIPTGLPRLHTLREGMVIWNFSDELELREL